MRSIPSVMGRVGCISEFKKGGIPGCYAAPPPPLSARGCLDGPPPHDKPAAGQTCIMVRFSCVALLASAAFAVSDAFVSPQARWVPAPMSARQQGQRYETKTT